MAEIDVLKAQLVRRDVNSPWGFRLQGGAEFDRPITIMSVRPGSPAHKIGLRAGDDVTEIGDTPTADLSSKQANDLILTYGLSLILTVERRARGAIPSNPVVSHPGPPAQLKSYQPYDLSGAMPTHHPHHHQVPQPQNYEIHTVSARPYDPPPGQRYHNPPPPQRTRPEPSGYSRNAYGGGDMGYDEEDGHQHQSRTFKILQSLMANEDERRDQGAPGTTIAPIQSDLLRAEDDIPYGTPHQSRTFRILQDMVGDEEPYSGSQGLPPPRSATREQQRPAQAQPQQDRVKVFMPQQYNTPITMYSAANIMDTFQGQAGAHIENMDEQRAASSSPISGAQQAVIEHDHGGFSEF